MGGVELFSAVYWGGGDALIGTREVLWLLHYSQRPDILLQVSRGTFYIEYIALSGRG